jgi:hypothetical protein
MVAEKALQLGPLFVRAKRRLTGHPLPSGARYSQELCQSGALQRGAIEAVPRLSRVRRTPMPPPEKSGERYSLLKA